MRRIQSAGIAVGLVLGTGGAWLWFARGAEPAVLGDQCLSLSTSVAAAPGVPAATIDYEPLMGLKVPVVPPNAVLDTFAVESGFRIEIVAHEPMIADPVAMDIDPDGRLWVVDLRSYMPVHDMSDWDTAVREQVPRGRIVVLEDTDADGRMDVSRVFQEGLILPRAIKVLRDGVLVAEPPNVWFIRDTTGDGRGDSRELVSSSYGDPNLLNVEGMPNGLMWGMDNWLHSARQAGESLRRSDEKWLTRPFEPIGQWGITQDNWGRIYSSNNSWPLEMNLVPHGYSERHPLFTNRAGIGARIAPNGPLWPARPAGVNRGYRVGVVVREDGTLLENTSASSTVIYRGDQFGDEFVGNAFTPEPAANMIQRILIDENPGEIEATARFAYEHREFLTSTDERFRPVNIYNAPDGSLYVVDMYRGLIQHARYLTDYLRDYAVERDLHKPNGVLGRIYRIVRSDRPIDYRTPRFSRLRPVEVVRYLQHKNGHLRDRAQQVLVQCSPATAVGPLEALVTDMSSEAYSRLQALWTLEGFPRSAYEQARLTQLALRALADPHPRVRAAAVRILEGEIAGGRPDVLARVRELAEHETSSAVRLQLIASIGEDHSAQGLVTLAMLLTREARSVYAQEMALTGTVGREAELARLLRTRYAWPDRGNEDHERVLASLSNATGKPMRPNVDHLTDGERQLFEVGRRQYAACSACHGSDGKGASGIGSPLVGSSWVQSGPPVIARIVLHGFSGGAAERRENVAGVMPGHAFLSDEDIAGILTFIRQSWGNDASPVGVDDIRRIRDDTDDRRMPWSPDELRRVNQ